MTTAGNESATSGETDSTRTVGDTVRGSKRQAKAGITGAIKGLFRQAVKAVTGRETDAPTPRKSGGRRRGEDSSRRFRKAASRLTRWRPIQAVASALIWLTDTRDWLDLWQRNGLTDETPQETYNNHLSPRL